jgi:hypothetical protein
VLERHRDQVREERPPGERVSVLGNVLARPAIISERNTPIDRAVPEFR